MLYFDTSFLAPLVLQESTSAKVERFVAGLPVGKLEVSHWTRAIQHSAPPFAANPLCRMENDCGR